MSGDCTSWRDMHSFCNPAIMIDRGMSVDDSEIINSSFRIDNNAGHNDDAAPDSGAARNYCRGAYRVRNVVSDLLKTMPDLHASHIIPNSNKCPTYSLLSKIQKIVISSNYWYAQNPRAL